MYKTFFKCDACKITFERTGSKPTQAINCHRCHALVAPSRTEELTPRVAFTVSLNHIDTCLPCYLQDHHNRPGELLVGVGICGATTCDTIKNSLLEQVTWCDFNEDFDCAHAAVALEEAMKAEIESAFAAVDLAELFDDSLDGPPSEESSSDDYCEAENAARESAAPDATPEEIEEAIAAARQAACDDAQREWENAETCYAWFLFRYEQIDVAEADAQFARDVLSRIRFHVSSEIVTPESAGLSDVESQEMLTCGNGVTLREAVKMLGGVGAADEISDWPMRAGSWFTNTEYDIDFRSGARESRSLFPPKTITDSSQLRLARIVHFAHRHGALGAVRATT